MRRLLPLFVLASWVFVCGCGPKGLQAKLQYAERKAGDVEASLDKAERAMSELDPDAAQEHLDDAKAALLDPDIDYYPEHGMLADRYKADSARMPAVRAEKERRDFEAKVAKRRQAMQKALAEFEQALQALSKKDVSESDVGKVNDAREDLEDELKDGLELEPKDSRYGSEAQAARLSMDRASSKIRLAHQTVQFVKGPGALHHDAVEQVKDAKGEKDAQQRLDAYVEARNLYRKCQEAASDILSSTPALEKVAIVVEDRTTTPKAVSTACTDGAASTEKTLVSLRAALKAAAKKPAKPARAAAKAPPKKRR